MNRLNRPIRRQPPRRLPAPRLRILAGTVSLALFIGLLAIPSAGAAEGDSILIFGPTLADASVNEQTIAESSGTTVTVWNDEQWAAAATEEFAAFDAIVFGDPDCVGSTSGVLDTAIDNRETWSPAVTGPMIVIGTDPIFHANSSGGEAVGALALTVPEAATTLTANAMDFAAGGSGTGLYMSLSCYYESAFEPTPVDLLAEFGSFTVHGESSDEVLIQEEAHPSMAGLTSADLSNWGISIHEVFDSAPATFGPIVTDATVEGSGLPYIIATAGGEPPVQHSLSVSVSGPGVVTSDPPGINCDGFESDCFETYNEGTVVTLTATPDEGASFDGWGEDDCAFAGASPTCVLTMDGDRFAAAFFSASEGQADLSLIKSDDAPFGPDPVSSGGRVAYRISVSNGGPEAATGVQVVDGATGGTVVRAIGSGWSCSIDSEANTATCDLAGALASGASASDLTVEVQAPTTSTDSVISDSATVLANESDPDPESNSDTENTTVQGTSNPASMDQAQAFYDGTQTVTVETARDTVGGFYSRLVIPPGLQPGVVSIDEFPASGPVPGVPNPARFCGGAPCDAQIQITVLPGGQTSATDPIQVFWFYTQPTPANKLYVKGDGERIASFVQACTTRGVASPAKCRNSITSLPNGDRQYLMLWRDGGDPIGGKRR